MKHYFKRTNVFLYICLALFAYSCSEENNFVKEQNHSKLKFEQKTFEEVLKIPIFNEAYRKITKSKSVFNESAEARTALEDQYGFTIVENSPVRITTDENGSVFYTLLIERDVKENLKFENLMIQVKDDEIAAAIFKYIMSEKGTKSQTGEYFFKDAVSSEFIDLNVEGKMFFSSNSDGDTCITTTQLMCNATWSGEPYDHIANYNCWVHAATYGLSSLYNTSSTVCYGNNDGGGNSDGGTSSNNTGGHGASGVSGNGALFIPTIPCKTVNCIEADETPCSKLKKLLQTPTSLPVNAISIKDAIENMRVRFSNTDREEGYNFCYTTASNQMYAFPAEQLASYKIKYRHAIFVFGGGHFHMDGLVPHFSHDDIPQLLNFFNQSQIPSNLANPSFPSPVHIIISELGVYALIPEDPTLFNSTIASIYADEEKRDLFRKKIEGMYKRLCINASMDTWSDDTDSYIEILLKFITNIDGDNNYNLGLALYRGTYGSDTKINGWEKLTIQKKPNTPNEYVITPTNCN